jgi:hypothetical protein
VAAPLVLRFARLAGTSQTSRSADRACENCRYMRVYASAYIHVDVHRAQTFHMQHARHKHHVQHQLASASPPSEGVVCVCVCVCVCARACVCVARKRWPQLVLDRASAASGTRAVCLGPRSATQVLTIGERMAGMTMDDALAGPAPEVNNYAGLKRGEP